MTDKLKSDVAGLEYPVDALKEIYIKSGRTASRIAKMFGISVERLMEYVDHYGWDELKADHEQRNMNTILKLRSESFVNNLNADQREQLLKDFQRNQELDEIEEHFEKYGHLFCIDEKTGEIQRDKYSGKPIKIKFGSTKEDILTRKEMMGSIELGLKLLEVDRVEKPKIMPAEPKQIGEANPQSAKSFLESDD